MILRLPRSVLLSACAAAALLLGIIAIGVGPVPLDVRAVLGALFGDVDDATTAIVLSIRLPRVALALLVGGGLAIAGATMQGLFRNPLADPGLIGVSSGAALAAVTVIVLGDGLFGGMAGRFALPIAAFAGSLGTTWFVYRLARFCGRTHIATMLLAGIAINALCGAVIGVLVYVANDDQLRSLTFWQMGSLGRAGWPEVWMCLAIMLPAMIWLLTLGRSLNALVLGDSEAQYLGIDVQRCTRTAIILCALLVGAGVAVSGVIGFIGLVIPHLIRLLIGPDHRGVLPGAACAGGALLVAADMGARTAAAPAELPVGLLTAAIGAPFFLVLLLQQRRGAV
ncbi:MAG: iron ABC transporter permease [Planctomycetes bacterium]|nr:iron ABC transporter permease [Planctomycetota bacterium]